MPFDIRFAVDIPGLKLDLANERSVLDSMAESMHRTLAKRINVGVDVDGATLPAPKDRPAQEPLVRTGQLYRSIRPTVRGSDARGFVAFAGPVTKSRRKVARILSVPASDGSRPAYRIFYLSDDDKRALTEIFVREAEARIKEG